MHGPESILIAFRKIGEQIKVIGHNSSKYDT